MSDMYVDSQCIVELCCVAFATPIDGIEAHDGRYFISMILIMPRGKSKDTAVFYPSKEERDAAFLELCSKVKIHSQREQRELEEEDNEDPFRAL